MTEPEARRTRTILTSQAKTNFSQLVDDVYTNGTRYIVQRFGNPRAVIISLEDFQRLLAAEGLPVHNLRESRVAYQLGEEKSTDEVLALLGGESDGF